MLAFADRDFWRFGTAVTPEHPNPLSPGAVAPILLNCKVNCACHWNMRGMIAIVSHFPFFYLMIIVHGEGGFVWFTPNSFYELTYVKNEKMVGIYPEKL